MLYPVINNQVGLYLIETSSEGFKAKGRRDPLVILFGYLMVPEFHLKRKIKGIVVITAYGVG